MRLVDTANKEVSILDVCMLIGMDMPDIQMGQSMKMYCPFGRVSHADGGLEPAFRVYPESNSAYCFAESQYFSPVWLFATAKDLRTDEAAEFLLQYIKYEDQNFENVWKTKKEDKIDFFLLADALKLFCERNCKNWEVLQFHPFVAHDLSNCLRLLNQANTSDKARNWLETTKKFMLESLIRNGNFNGANN